MPGHHMLRAYFGFAPHQLSGVLQERTDKGDHYVKPHTLPIVPSHVVWRVSSIARATSTNKLCPNPPAKLGPLDVKWCAAPLPEIKDMGEEPASVKHFIQQPSKRAPTRKISKDPHKKNAEPIVTYAIPQSVDEVEGTPQSNTKRRELHENTTLFRTKTGSRGFDLLSGFRSPGGAMTTQDWLNRCLFLETMAGVPGLVETMALYLHSLRSITRDDIYSLRSIDDLCSLFVENEDVRMNLAIFMNMKQSAWVSRITLVAAQSIVFPAFALIYLISPRSYHRVVESLEEELVKTYTIMLDDMEHGHLDEWCTTAAPAIGRSYYNLPDDAKVYDMLKSIRAEEASRMPSSQSQKRDASLIAGQH